jgi:tensin
VELLKHQSPGSFIIHKASHKSGNFILSLRVPSKSSKVLHHLIVQSKRGYRLKGEKKMFPTVSALVTHHSVMAESLPVALAVHRPENLVKKCSENDDFSSIEDLREIFTGLEL